jgi:hypothetical protein
VVVGLSQDIVHLRPPAARSTQFGAPKGNDRFIQIGDSLFQGHFGNPLVKIGESPVGQERRVQGIILQLFVAAVDHLVVQSILPQPAQGLGILFGLEAAPDTVDPVQTPGKDSHRGQQQHQTNHHPTPTAFFSAFEAILFYV